MQTALVNAIKNIIDLPPLEENKLRGIVAAASFRKGGIFVGEGTVPQKFAFVNSGLFRYYYVNEKGSEFTKGFFSQHSFITSYTAMIKQRPSYYTIEALEDSDVLVLDYREWKKLYTGHSCWTGLLLALVERGYIKKEARERELLLFSAEERYRLFLQEYPQLEGRVKQHMIASYLGITAVALSRIRKSMTTF